MPRKRGQGQRRQSQKTHQDGPGQANLVGNGFGEEPGQHPNQPRGNGSLRHVDIEIGPTHAGQHADEIGDQQAQAHDQNGRPLHVQSAEPIEAGQRESHAKERDAQCSGPEHLPEAMADLPPHRTSDR
jgi:hypothetical protein